MQLRDYQSAGINNIRAQFSKGYKRICFVSPCGSGKTRMMEYMAVEAEKRNNHTLFLVHRQELITQASQTFREDHIDHGIIAPGYRMRDRAIQIASVQTVSRRLPRIIKPELIIPDECHHATAKTWKSVIDYFPDAYVVGLTATPARLNGQGLGDVFESLVIGPTAKFLIDKGYLAPYKYYAPPMVADMTGVKTKMGDFDNAETAIRMDKPSVVGDAIMHYKKLANGRQAIAYCTNIQHSKNTAVAFQAAGINAKHLDGTTPKAERKQAIDDFRAGKITVICNVDLFGEGLDISGIEAVILLRPTQSLTLYIQQSMRGMRPERGNPFKTAIILDHVGNVFRHGLPDDDREWSLESKRRTKKSEPCSVPIRVCPKCFWVDRPGPVCPGCGYVYPVQERKIEEKAGELQEIKFTPEQRKRRKCAVGMCRTIADLEAIARERHYKPAWVRIQAKLKHIRS